jgi:hypothetical protein
MTETPKYRDDKLPVTGEVGSEGGSYAEPTFQEAAEHGDIATESQPVAPDPIVPPGPDPDRGMKKPPAE